MMVNYELPLSEVVFDFFDRLKSITKGYGSFEYEVGELRVSKLVKLDIRLNGEVVDALSIIVHKDRAYSRGKILCERLRKTINRQQYDVAIQAAIEIGDLVGDRKGAADVTAKCYGGDISRKRKLLQKQKAGKKRMKQVGNVEVPQEASRHLIYGSISVARKPSTHLRKKARNSCGFESSSEGSRVSQLRLKPSSRLSMGLKGCEAWRR